MRQAVLILPVLATLAGCAQHAKLVMLNPRTGQQVDCDVPDPRASSGEFLVSRACVSACQAHGFRAVPGASASGVDLGTPVPCSQ